MTARRAPARKPPTRPARRSRRPGKAPYREVIFGSAAVAGPVAWQWAGELWAARGLLALTVLSVAVVPVVMLAVITAPVSVAKSVVPKRLLRWWRRGGHWWRSRPARHPRPGALLVRMIRAADRNRCVGCGITQAQVLLLNTMTAQWQQGARRRSGLQLDHYFPFALGGNLIVWNLFLLCPRCNQVKSDYWKDRSGRVTYRPFWGLADRHEAARIARREWLARFSVARWWRAAWAL